MKSFLEKSSKIIFILIIAVATLITIAFAKEEPNADPDVFALPFSAEKFRRQPDTYCIEQGVKFGETQDSILHGNQKDFDTSSDVYIDDGGGWHPTNINSVKKGSDYRDKDTSVGNRETISNMYIEKKGWTPNQVGTNFILAVYGQKFSRGDYRLDPVQSIIWIDQGASGNPGAGNLSDAKAKFAKYTEDVKNIKIKVTCPSNVGTVLDGDYYKVGPFHMDNYIRAKDYVFSSDTWGPYGDLESAFRGYFNDTKERGTISSAVALLDNGKNISFSVPKPNSNFYVYIPVSEVGDAEEVVSLRFTYEVIEESGDGIKLEGHQIVAQWAPCDDTNGCNSYDCTTCQHKGIARSGRSAANKTHDYWCGTTGYCEYGKSAGEDLANLDPRCKRWKCGLEEHTHDENCYDADGNLTCNKEHHHNQGDWEGKCGEEGHYCTCDYCVDGFKDGKHSGDDWQCKGATKCKHGYLTCMKFNWKISSMRDQTQDVIKAHGKLIPTPKIITVAVHVPLKANVSVYKYISKVEHENGTVLYDLGETRKYNKPDTVKVEKGDIVTFTIDIENESKFDVNVKLEDILPNDARRGSQVSAISGVNMPWEVGTSSGIRVKAHQTYRIYVTLTPEATTGIGTNTIRITNTPQTEYYSYYGHGPGPVVNMSNHTEDSDSYEIKEYAVNVDKYISKVEHLGNGVATYNANARRNIDENIKRSNPVYVEYGDRVTYNIDLYNTTSPYTSNRNNGPYWNPDKVYVDIEDYLPAKYSNVHIGVSNNSGKIGTISGGQFKIEDVIVPAGGVTRITVTLVVEEHDKNAIEPNRVRFVGSILNINQRAIKNHPTKTSSADSYHLNNYDMSINKYISNYDQKMTKINNEEGLTKETVNFTDRSVMSETDKSNKPLAVEKTETVVYSIRLDNNSKQEPKGLSSGIKEATSVRPSEVTDVLDYGLTYKGVSAKVYKADGSDKYGNITVSAQELGNNTYKFIIPNKTSDGKILIVDPGEYIIYYVTVEVTQSNMYLQKLSNMGIITTLTNINNTDDVSRIVKNDKYNENISQKQTSSEFVKLKDLVIAGKVWLDADKDGYMGKEASGKLNSYVEYSSDLNNGVTSPDEDAEYAVKGVIVKLYRVNKDGEEPTLIRTTKTNEKGLFTFGKQEDGETWYEGVYSYEDAVKESEQRIPKATDKDDNLNYTSNSKYISYYVEYQYDGLTFKSTEVYSGTDNLNNDGSFKSDKYKIDSNAREFEDQRKEFNLQHEIIGYNKAYNADLSTQRELAYEKVDHNSYLKFDAERGIIARSFLVKDSEGKDSTKYLWLFKPAVDTQKPETEYLKYINLGLEKREDVDIDVVQDVYEMKNTINGEEMTYWYNQNKYALDGSSVDHADNGSSENYESKFYMTRKKADSNNDKVAINPYEFKYYMADYKYKVENYNIATLREYKSKDSELNSEITFRIKVTNNAFTNDEPYKEVKDIKVYTGINEVIEYFDNRFMNVEYNEDGTVKTINIKTKDDDGYLKDTPIKIVDCWFVLPDGSKLPATMTGKNTSNDVLTLANSSIYNEGRTIEGYNTVYIRPNINGVNKIILAEGENVDILIKFIVGKDEERNLKLGLATNIAEIGAYSTYYKDEDGKYISAGLVDKDSNPGNFGEAYDGISFDASKNNKANDPYLKLYEDDTYKTGIDLTVETEGEGGGGNERSIRCLSGIVWDDARSEEAKAIDGSDTLDGIQYIGDGKNGTVEGIDNKTSNENAKLNKVLKTITGAYKEKNDFVVKDVGVSLVENVRVPVDATGKVITDGNGTVAEERVYEDVIIPDPENSVVDTRTDDNGKYTFEGYIPGEYIVRFSYGDNSNLEQMNIFNGQDYKSTTYQAGSEYADTAYLRNGDGAIVRDSLNNPKKDTDKVLKILEAKGISDAKDDEMRRLETISYSETLNNNKTLVLRGVNSTNKKLQSEKTSMYAETADFLVRAEKEKQNKNILNYAETAAKIVLVKRHEINNIDLGLQYRPEQQVGLNKYVKSIKVTTSNTTGGTTEPLVDAKFNEYYGLVIKTDNETGVTEYLGYKDPGTSEYVTIPIPEDYLTGDVSAVKSYVNNFLSIHELSASSLNKKVDDCKKNPDGTFQIIIAGTELDTEKSIGLANLQYVPNDKDSHAIDSNQGFVYLNIDDDIMQGAEVKIEYLFVGHNLSEIDRVSKNLSKLRFKDNMTDAEKAYYAASDVGYNAIAIDAMRAGGTLGEVGLITKTNSEGETVSYSGALTAKNDLFNEYYRYEIESINPAKATVSDTGEDVIYRIKTRTIGESASDYYGRYLGSTYYTGKVSDNEVVSELKLNKILDYVDNNLVFKEEDNSDKEKDRFWRKTTASELVLGGYINPSILEFSDADKTAVASMASEVTQKATETIQKYSNKSKLISYLNFALSSGLELSSVKDYTDILDRGLLLDSDGVAYNTSERSNLALMQDVRTSDSQTANDIVNADISKFLTPRDSKDENSFGSVKIITSKIVSAEDDTSNMTYENVGEVVEYSSVSGRITSLATTLGNVKISDAKPKVSNSSEYEGSKVESDTASVEKVTLTPPTGLSRTRTILRTVVKGASYVAVTGVILSVIALGALGGVIVYRKRRIK